MTLPCRAFGLALLLWACGGNVEPDDGAGGAGGTPSNPSTGGAGGIWGDPSKLGPCDLGFLPREQPTRRCPWTAEGRCYDTKEDACACICPTDRVTTCLSGFPGGDDAPVAVECV